MRELSLHILDLVENAVKAGASVVTVSVFQIRGLGLLEVAVEDNGKGLEVPQDVATDPFYTTSTLKKTGLGLSLFKGGVERSGGSMVLSTSPLGGLSVRATMPMTHVDRSPLGDLAGTLFSVVCANPELELVCRLRVDGREIEVTRSAVGKKRDMKTENGIAVAKAYYEKIREGMNTLDITQ
ncbi:MAG: HAMP domain-containing histidine kinase [Spirochaetes bacterium]|nr:HAMP domain-containing histidine kinase [Spirochaetota bacterium]